MSTYFSHHKPILFLTFTLTINIHTNFLFDRFNCYIKYFILMRAKYIPICCSYYIDIPAITSGKQTAIILNLSELTFMILPWTWFRTISKWRRFVYRRWSLVYCILSIFYRHPGGYTSKKFQTSLSTGWEGYGSALTVGLRCLQWGGMPQPYACGILH